MNPQGIVRRNADADEPAPVAGGPSATLDANSGIINKPAVPDYELLQRIGGGAYGEVFLARSKATGVLRAAKIVWRRSFEDDRPFQREFEGIQRFERVSREHPSQLSLFHIGRNEAGGYFYYVMELADDVRSREAPAGGPSPRTVDSAQEGSSDASPSAETAHSYQPRTLRADLAHGRLPIAQVLEIGITLTEALERLHRSGLVHRDVKPSNVIFVNGRPKLADIGLVTDASDTRSIVGTEGYLPPEGPGTPQADIFALGKVLYEAATGQDRRQFPDLPPNLKEWPDRTAVLEVNEIVVKACGSNAGGRYRKCEEMLAELNLLAHGKSVKRERRHHQRLAACKKAGWASAALAVVLGALIHEMRQFAPSGYSSEGPPSTNMEANALCDQAMYIVRGDNYLEIRTALSNLTEAARLDTNFVRPYVGLLEMRAREDVPGMPYTSKEDLRAITRNLERLAPHSAATYIAEAILSSSDWNYPEAMRLAAKASKADPTYELGHTWRSWLLECCGRPEEALKEIEISRELAPSQTIVYRALGNNEFVERHYTNAIQWYKTSIKWEPHHSVPYNGIGLAYQALGDYTNALVYFEKEALLMSVNEVETKGAWQVLRHALDEGGIPGYWQQQWKWTRSGTNTDCYWKAKIQIHLGHTDRALDWLERSYEVREGRDQCLAPLGTLLYDNEWDGVRDDPRFLKLLDNIGYTKVMPPRKP